MLLGSDLPDHPMNALWLPRRPFVLLFLCVIVPTLAAAWAGWSRVAGDVRMAREYRALMAPGAGVGRAERDAFLRDQEASRLRTSAEAGAAYLPSAGAVLEEWRHLDKTPADEGSAFWGANERSMWWFVGLLTAYALGLPAVWAYGRGCHIANLQAEKDKG